MKSLAETNPYIRDEKKRMEMIEHDVVQSSAFEGVRDGSLRKTAVKERCSTSEHDKGGSER